MHNVEAWNPGLCPGCLVLSNTPQTVGRLSFPKPPHRQCSFAASLFLPDGIPSLEPGNTVSDDPFRDPLDSWFLQFWQKGLFTGPDYSCFLQ